MKKVISGEELKKVMSDAVNLLCDTVSSTLGPTGNNILINNSEVTPFITNDGVTIASNIESEDEKINTVLEIVKEASLKTNELVGDGTTTTLVLLQSIFNLGLEEINNGKNKIVLKNELLSCMNKVVEEINKLKQEPTDDDLLSIATTSSNDYEIGKLTTEIFGKVKSKYSIKLEESNNEETYSINKKGYNIPINNISSMYFTKNKTIELKDVNVLVLKGYFDNLESISDIVNDALENDKNLLILVEAMNEEIKNEVLVYYFNHKNIFVVELEEYSSHRDKIEEDISFLSKSNIKNIDYEETTFSDLGIIDNVIIKNDEIVLLDSKNSIELINKLKEELKTCNSDYEKEFIASRISKLEEGITTIYVGGTTKSERREKLMRFEDAICALETAKNGIVIGEGITYLKVSEILESDNTASMILKKSLEKPFEKVMENLGLDYKDIKNNIIKNKYNLVYDYKINDYVSINNSNIIDPADVIICAFKNALSISSILLSTSSLVINLKEEINNNIM
ncbi:MAG: hypothetical protein IJ097_02390 [Bacilli bacterium]|nr:hypothetical protein [Bacilli bacterium]